MVEFCGERVLRVGNTYFKHRSLHKYTRVAKGQDGVEVKSMIDPVLVKKDMLRYNAGCEGSERNGSRPLRPPCCTA